MKVIIIPLNEDNYGYLLIDESTNEGAVIDVSNQPETVFAKIQSEGVIIKKILSTHKHWDHSGGNDKMKELLPGVEIYGSATDNCEGCTNFISDGDVFYVSGIKVTCLHTPGHTMGHISFYVEHNDQRAVFTGDCLFLGGAGRFFEGTANDMYPSLYEKLGRLPSDTLVYCGHEYTLSNYKFALSIDGENSDLISQNDNAKKLREEGKPTIPSTIGLELKTNPFLRVDNEKIRANLGFGSDSDAVAVLAAVREAKNNFK